MVVDVVYDEGPGQYLRVQTQYYTGSLKVDGVAMHNEAARRRDLGEGSIVHAHLHLERCNEDCVRYI